jgi:hypothetical protein
LKNPGQQCGVFSKFAFESPNVLRDPPTPTHPTGLSTKALFQRPDLCEGLSPQTRDTESVFANNPSRTHRPTPIATARASASISERNNAGLR